MDIPLTADTVWYLGIKFFNRTCALYSTIFGGILELITLLPCFIVYVYDFPNEIIRVLAASGGPPAPEVSYVRTGPNLRTDKQTNIFSQSIAV